MALGDSVSANRFSVDLGKFQVATVESVSGLGYGQENGEQVRNPTPRSGVTSVPSADDGPGEVTITRGADAEGPFTDWVHRTSEQQGPVQDAPDITITQHDGDNKPMVRYHLTNAWASTWKGPTLEAGGAGSATESVTISYEEAKIEAIQ
ncbi:phage tail protein [Streptomyces piniterrae]|uniref:Phage tail protein n=1 Tax=Streptomyces piniterrae TaxID=2571125 RepID=A0A4V5MKQ1_9ACTN|nr:phage tail protein [Streptomyces piniterrae]TJZ54188.1 phage tail protein [Streptomyces piniterrae]